MGSVGAGGTGGGCERGCVFLTERVPGACAPFSEDTRTLVCAGIFPPERSRHLSAGKIGGRVEGFPAEAVPPAGGRQTRLVRFPPNGGQGGYILQAASTRSERS